MPTTTDIPRVLAKLTKLRPGPHRFVTCYLKLEPRDRARGKYLIKVKNRIKAAEQSLEAMGLTRESREAVQRDLGRVQEFLANPGQLPATQGLAIFACEPLGLFETLPLPRVHRSRVAVDRAPLVRELASVEDEFGRLLTVIVDRTAARIFQVTAFRADELVDLRADSTRGGRFHSNRKGAPGRGEHAHHNRIREEKQRHFELVAHQLFDLYQKSPAYGLVLAGPGPEAGVLEPFLHPYLAERLLGFARLNPKEATAPQVHAATLVVREAFERAAERAVVHELEESLGTGWGVNGTGDTLNALCEGKVRTLLVDADAGGPGFRYADSGRLTLGDRGGRSEGEPVPVLDIVDEAIEEALRQRVNVEVVYDAEARKSFDGLGALLRFR